MSRKLYVGNIPFETNENDLQELFAESTAPASAKSFSSPLSLVE